MTVDPAIYDPPLTVGPRSTGPRQTMPFCKTQLGPTCLIESAVAVLESAYARTRGYLTDLSTAYLYWVARIMQYPGQYPPPFGAVSIPSMREAIIRAGTCETALWPDTYETQQIAPYHGVIPFATYRAKDVGDVLHRYFKITLQTTPIACQMYAYEDWSASDMYGDPSRGLQAERDTVYPPDREDRRGVPHALVIAGYDDDHPWPDDLGQGCWLVRETRGQWWADHGYVWVPYTHEVIAPWTITEVV